MTLSRDDVLTHIDEFLTYVDARDLAEFLERVLEEDDALSGDPIPEQEAIYREITS